MVFMVGSSVAKVLRRSVRGVFGRQRLAEGNYIDQGFETLEVPRVRRDEGGDAVDEAGGHEVGVVNPLSGAGDGPKELSQALRHGAVLGQEPGPVEEGGEVVQGGADVESQAVDLRPSRGDDQVLTKNLTAEAKPHSPIRPLVEHSATGAVQIARWRNYRNKINFSLLVIVGKVSIYRQCEIQNRCLVFSHIL
jgi:hypothetical protein